jgi:hypothetical protein
LPHLERLVVSKHDIGRFHVRLSQAAARWQLRQGRIGTLEVSRWPQTSSVVNLVDAWTTSVRARESGQAFCQIDVSSHVRHYVFRDLPRVTQIRLQGKMAETVRLEGDLSSLKKIQDEYLDAELIIAPTAKVGDVSRDRR